jgi:hypothetical protein
MSKDPPLWELIAAYQESVREAVKLEKTLRKILGEAPTIDLEKWR